MREKPDGILIASSGSDATVLAIAKVQYSGASEN
jgi:hypothetical protein